MKKLIVLTLAFAALLCAADEARVQKIVPVRNGDAVQVFATVRDLMTGPALNVKLYQTTVVLNGTPEAVAAAEQLIKNLETSSPRDRDIEVTGYIVLAFTQAGEGGGAMPGELEPVLKQFRNLLNYKSFRVLDTVILRGKENSPMSTGGFLALPNAPGATDDFFVQKPSVHDDVVRLKELNLRVHIPTTRLNDKGQVITSTVAVATDAEVKIGQKVAIGKASVNAVGDALILVISANVVN